ncbi:FG-GAP repeat domain-containing protein [Acanthopleuribacter pedis]|uniref:VCBS repeat-containing protein n=1 Tax=Acanthopleuribacter pedis TaxID=442870 RepID=A0A8J7QN09_9BACT|nr:VCBS repeat-containing protein [Acanthopleuribacter pedis]MBO1320995.1 VCBS repeat-containing protein [Acanthopleuribacter pedis]
MRNLFVRSMVLTLASFLVLAGLTVSAQEPREGVVYWDEPPAATGPAAIGPAATGPAATGPSESFIQTRGVSQKLATCGDGNQEDGELCYSSSVALAPPGSSISGIDVGRLNGGSNVDFVVSQWLLDRMISSLGTGAGTFYNTQTRSMGDGPTDIKMGDFNNDGITDIMATNLHKDRVRIRWGHNNWQTWSFYKTGDGPRELVVGDLNGDGRDDFVTANTGDDTITVGVKRSGSGFRLTTLYVGAGNSTVALADMNNDGDLDILHDGAGRLRLRLNNGSGSFGSPTTLVTSPSGNTAFPSIATADVDGDGYRDIVANHGYNQMVLVRRTGSGGYRNPVFADLDTGALFKVQLHDMDDDGFVDIITNEGNTTMNIYLGNGNGSFSSGNVINTLNATDFEVADFNNDGFLDIIYTGTEARLLLANP